MATDKKTVGAEKRVVDWESLEAHYRSGIKSLKEIGIEYKVSAPAILKHAKKNGWVRDLGAKIRAKADAKVNAAMVNEPVNAKRAVNEQEVIEANSDMQYRVRMSHRVDIQRVKSLLHMLLSEAEHQTANQDLYRQLGELLDTGGPGADGKVTVDKLNEIYRKAMSLPSRVGVLKQVTETLALLIKLEREAFGIDESDKGLSPIDEILKRINTS